MVAGRLQGVKGTKLEMVTGLEAMKSRQETARGNNARKQREAGRQYEAGRTVQRIGGNEKQAVL